MFARSLARVCVHFGFFLLFCYSMSRSLFGFGVFCHHTFCAIDECIIVSNTNTRAAEIFAAGCIILYIQTIEVTSKAKWKIHCALACVSDACNDGSNGATTKLEHTGINHVHIQYTYSRMKKKQLWKKRRNNIKIQWLYRWPQANRRHNRVYDTMLVE